MEDLMSELVQNNVQTEEVEDANVLTQQKIDQIDKEVRAMNYHLGNDFDPYYPSINDLDRLGEGKDAAHKQYSIDEIAFLLWIQYPLFELNADQEEVKDIAEDIVEDALDEDKNDLKDVFRKYN